MKVLMSYEQYTRESEIKEKNQKEYEKELVRSILITRNKLDVANKNYEYAEDELIDYYLYKIKAEKAKYNYLLRKAKQNGIILDFIKDTSIEDIKVV